MTRISFASFISLIASAAVSLLVGPNAWSGQTTLKDLDKSPGTARITLQDLESKKGLQVQMVDDALALGVHHAAFNVDLVEMTATRPAIENESIAFEGERFEFDRHYVEMLDATILPLTTRDVSVYLILLACNPSKPDLNTALIHPRFEATRAPISAFKTSDPASAKRFQASVTFLAQRYIVNGGPPVHFIVGNEVNSHGFWYNMGEARLDDVVAEYEHTVRLCRDAVRGVSKTSRVFVSLDHHWGASASPNEPLKSFGARAFLDAFARRVKANGDFGWHVAFHPYPENLFDPRTWNDRDATLTVDTPKITFKNIELLNDFMKRPELMYGGKPRRIILSEQGFHTANGPEGEAVQAAAYAYAYQKTKQLDGIDAFILHRHVDHLHEGGLNLGLWTCDKANNPAKKKAIYDVFRAADTFDWEEAFRFALPIIGISSWAELR
ncbi:MAG: DUF5722 domain-containing protein [Planctomycetota bacterium]